MMVSDENIGNAHNGAHVHANTHTYTHNSLTIINIIQILTAENVWNVYALAPAFTMLLTMQQHDEKH